MCDKCTYLVINFNWGKLITFWPLKSCSKGMLLGNAYGVVGWGEEGR